MTGAASRSTVGLKPRAKPAGTAKATAARMLAIINEMNAWIFHFSTSHSNVVTVSRRIRIITRLLIAVALDYRTPKLVIFINMVFQHEILDRMNLPHPG